MADSTAKSTERPGESAKPREDGIDALDPALAIVESFKPLTRPPLRLTAGVLAAGAVVVATLAILGYEAYWRYFHVDILLSNVRLSPAVGGDVSARETTAVAGSPGRSAAPIDPPAAKLDIGAASPGATASQTEAAPQAAEGTGSAGRSAAPIDPPAAKLDSGAASAGATASQTRAAPKIAARAPAPPRRPNAQAAAAQAAGLRQAPRTEPCAEAIAAIGLCALRPSQATAAKAAPAVAGKTAPLVQSGAGPCTEALTALGLCTPASNVKKE